jgi:transcriptional regulator with XRE-family HTH domain
MQSGPKRRVQLGPSGEQVRLNVRRLRERLGLSQSQLARLTATTNRPLAATAINEIENGARRVDVDDLMALTGALGVNPNALLMPHRAGDDHDVELSGIGLVNSIRAWQWARGYAPIRDVSGEWSDKRAADNDRATFRMRIEPRALPPRDAVLADRAKWVNDQTIELALELDAAGDSRDAEEIRRQMEALIELDPHSDAQWSAMNETD